MQLNTNRPKIVFVNLWSKGGMRHYSDCLVKNLTESFEVIYISNYDNFLNQGFYRMSLNLFDYNNYISLWRTLRAILINKPDVIHVNSGHPLLLLIMPIFYFYNSIITVHDAVPHEGEKLSKRLYHKIQLFLISFIFTKVVVHSSKIADELPVYISKNKIQVMEHVNFSALVKKFDNVIKQKFTILFFGRILEYKGLEYLVEAFQQLDQDKYELIIAGEGDIEFNINTNNITLINRFISDDEMHFQFNQADVVVTPYTSASQSGVIYMAQAYCKPVITTNVGSLADNIIDGMNGFVVPARSAEALATAITKASDKHIYESLVLCQAQFNRDKHETTTQSLKTIYAIKSVSV